MVEENAIYEVVVTADFLDDLDAAVDYIEFELGSPVAARKMYYAIKAKVEALAVMPTVALAYAAGNGDTRYKFFYGNYVVHFAIEGAIVRVLALKHQLQNPE